MTIDEMIAVLQAAKAGKQIQYFVCNDEWRDAPSPAWNFDLFHYRVKPEPREFWLARYLWAPIAEYEAYDKKPSPRFDDHEVIHVREVLP